MSTVVLYMAISADGFIAGPNDSVDWVSDDSWKTYQAFVSECDVVIVGKNTFKLMAKREFIREIRYIIATNDQSFNAGDFETGAIKSVDDMPQANKIGVIGGGELNGSLAKLGVINEIMLDIEPILLGQGKRLFGSHELELKLKLLSSRQIGQSTIQNHYRVER